MRFRIRFREAGGHTHMRMFSGQGNTLGKCGDLVMRNDEFVDFKAMAKFIEFVAEEDVSQ